MYTDAHLVGQGAFGPYAVINTIPTDVHEPLPMAAVLRLHWHIPERNPMPDMARSNQDTFHGGGLPDELAALISLALGVRMQAGGVVREFRDEEDPRGTPVQHGHRRPELPNGRQRSIPALAHGNLASLDETLDFYRHVQPRKAIEVVRSARSYQQGVWMADADPEYAWLKFVSALETAANCWWRGDNDPAAALEYSKPELAEILRRAGGGELIAEVGELLKDQLRATRKFYDFTTHYRPDPPADRPPVDLQTSWDELAASMRLIYGYRSKSLHAGKPFPAPLLEPAVSLEQGQPVVEKPLGLAVGFGQAVWQAGELPLLLHVFEHITRMTLLAWMHDADEGPSAQL